MPVTISKSEEDKMMKQWKCESAQWIQRDFEQKVMNRNVVLETNKLSSRVVKAFSLTGQSGRLQRAQTVWQFIREPQHNVKPNHLMYSQMLAVYRNALVEHRQFESFSKVDWNINMMSQEIHQRSKFITEQAVITVNEWTHAYESGSDSLRDHLCTLDIRSPVIFNQIIRLIMDRENTFCWQNVPWMLRTIRFYVRKCLELRIEPGQTMKDMLVKLVRRASTFEEVRFIVDEMVIPVIGKDSFLMFDVSNQYKIFNRIVALGYGFGELWSQRYWKE